MAAKAARAKTAPATSEKKDPVYTVARLEPMSGKLIVVELAVSAKTQEKAMDAVAAAGGGLEAGDSASQFTLVAWLAGSTRAKKFTRRTVPVTESEHLEIAGGLFTPARPVAVEG